MIELFIALDRANLLDQILEIETNSPSERYHEAFNIFGRYVGRRKLAEGADLAVCPSPAMRWSDEGCDDLRSFANFVRSRIGVGHETNNTLIYVRRRPHFLGRFYLNEEAVVRTLKCVAAQVQLEFRDVRLEDENFESQVKLMSETKVLVGLHGAAFANSIFCKPSSKIIQFWPDTKFKHEKFERISDLMQLSHSHLNVNRISFPNFLSLLRLPVCYNPKNRHRILRDRILLADTNRMYTEMCKILAKEL